MQSVRYLGKILIPELIRRPYRRFSWRYRHLRWLPGTSRQFGPPRHWLRLVDYLKKHPGSMRVVMPAQQLNEFQATCIGPVSERFFSRIKKDIPPAAVLELPQARLLGPDGWIVGTTDSLILDTSYHAYWDEGMNADGHWILKRRRARPLRRLAGRTLSLASDFAAGGFAHFVHDSLCRLHLLELAGINPADFDHIYWPRLPSAGATQLVSASGVPPEKIIFADSGYDFECETLTATTFPGRPAHLSPPYVEFLRRRFAPAPLGAGRKIYLSRSGFVRQIVNLPQIETILASHGYEICHAHIDPDILSKCAAATHVISLEGSGFYNAFAAPSGTRSLIILPDQGQTLPYNQMLAHAAGHRLFLMMAYSLPVASGEDPTLANVHLDPSLFERALNAMDTAP